ncbi:MAG TPA: hypothetical protein VK539_22080, partial [Myxococcaceae bacterium]|nr:hypothetical protein [Myxococcaceae bacterium]
MADVTPVLDVVCMGETLVDFLPAQSGKRVREVSSWSPAIGIRPAMDVLTRLEAGQVPCSAKIASWRGQVSGEDGAECAQAAAARS